MDGGRFSWGSGDCGVSEDIEEMQSKLAARITCVKVFAGLAAALAGPVVAARRWLRDWP
jgi:hypothetical protein